MPNDSDKPPKPFPSRDDVVAFIAREHTAATAEGRAPPAKIGKREIARAFGISGGPERIALKRMLKELEADGAIARRRGEGLARRDAPPATIIADVVARDRDGDLIARPSDWDTAQFGPSPKIVLRAPPKPSPGRPAPAIGDRALLRIEPTRDATEGAAVFTGRVVKLLARGKTQALGVFRAGPHGGGRLEPVSKKSLGREFVIAPGLEGEAQDGDLVSVEVLREGRFGAEVGKIRERFGPVSGEKAASEISIHAHGLPHVFTPQALEEALRAQNATMAGREDWRAVPLVTIDPADAKDHDDAVQAEPDSDPENPGGFVLRVAIADVAAYVRPDRPLDRDALERGNSVYFPDRVVPMLPERISNDLCSLKAGVDRPALAVRMTIDARGRKLRHSFHRVMIRSAAKLAYAQAQAAVDGAPDDTTGALLDPALRPLWAAYAALVIERERRAPLDLDLPERKLLLKADGTLDRVVSPPRLDAHRLIEEFMILANVAAAETLEDKRQTLIYRAHDEPSAEKLNNLAEFLSTIGVKLAKGQVLRPSQFNRILAGVRGQDNEHLVNEVVLRSQAQAEYVAENYGHFGLNLRRYAHFTSPIRRYADLIVHRALIRALAFGDDGLPNLAPGELAEVATRISAAERRAMAAERETVDRLIAMHLADQVGAKFSGRISGVTRAGLFVKLADTGADGFIPAATLGDEYFRYEESARALIGSRTGLAHRLGDSVEVRLVEAAPLAGALRFELMGAGARGPRRQGGPPRGVATGKGRRGNGGEQAMTLSRPADHPVDQDAPRDLWLAIGRGFVGRCPHCGKGAMFGAYLKVVDACPVCGEALHHHRADDAPPYVTILIVAHVIGALIFFVEERSDALPLWLVTTLWSALTIVLVLTLLPRVKGALIGLQWANRMHGFGGPEAPSPF